MKLSEILNKRNKILENIEYYKEQLQIAKSSLGFEEQELRILDDVDLYRENKDGVMHPSWGFIPVAPDTGMYSSVLESYSQIGINLNPDWIYILGLDSQGYLFVEDKKKKCLCVCLKCNSYVKEGESCGCRDDKIKESPMCKDIKCAICNSTGFKLGKICSCSTKTEMMGGIVSGELPDSIASEVNQSILKSVCNNCGAWLSITGLCSKGCNQIIDVPRRRGVDGFNY